MVFARHDYAKMVVNEGWVREMIPDQEVTAAYMTIENPSDQAEFLTGASCEHVKATEIHAMTQEDDLMKMKKLDHLEIPANGKVELKPGGDHLILIGLKRSFKEGETMRITLNFKNSGRTKVELHVHSREMYETST